MTQDTEDVVARLTRFAETLSVNRHYMTGQGCMEAQDDLRALLAERQSLSDRIDVLSGLALKVVSLHDEVVGCTRPGGVDADEYDDAFEDLRRAALHQEGIAP